MSQSFIRLSEVLRRTGYSKAWIYRLLKEKRFPQPVKIGSRSIAFVEMKLMNGLTNALLNHVVRWPDAKRKPPVTGG